MDNFSLACKDFNLIISLKKTKVMGQGIEHPPAITIINYELEDQPRSTGGLGPGLSCGLASNKASVAILFNNNFTFTVLRQMVIRKEGILLLI